MKQFQKFNLVKNAPLPPPVTHSFISIYIYLWIYMYINISEQSNTKLRSNPMAYGAVGYTRTICTAVSVTVNASISALIHTYSVC